MKNFDRTHDLQACSTVRQSNVPPCVHLVSSTDHKILRRAVFPTSLLPRPSWVQISSAPYCQTVSTYVSPPSVKDRVSHPYKTTGKIIIISFMAPRNALGTLCTSYGDKICIRWKINLGTSVQTKTTV